MNVVDVDMFLTFTIIMRRTLTTFSCMTMASQGVFYPVS